MSNRLISHNADLKKLREEGFEIEIVDTHLLAHHVPYVTPKKEISYGILVAPLGNMTGDRVGKPADHTIYFKGELPCDNSGTVLNGIMNSSARKKLTENIEVDHYFSAKPPSGNYSDYYDKITTYVNILSSQAESIDRSVSAKTYRVPETKELDSVFNYSDTNSVRAEIVSISTKLKDLKIAIIGLGGTGSYVLDFVAKTPVGEIHLFDEDDFLSHNAFRAPGAASIETLRTQTKKVTYLNDVYSKMRTHIISHTYNLTPSTLDELSGMNFAFICIDGGEVKKAIIQKLTETSIPFVDTGMGIEAVGESLNGSVRVTTGTANKNDHINKRISFSDKVEDDYDKNIQIAEINALNAALAVIKWKKLFGFYHDLIKEYHSVYNIDCNQLLNEESANP